MSEAKKTKVYHINSIPVSLNDLYRVTIFKVRKKSGRGYMYQGKLRKSTEGLEFTEKVHRMIEAQGIEEYFPKGSRVELRAQVTVNRITRDVDNTLKILLDSLEEVLFDNDNQVHQIIIRKIVRSKKVAQESLQLQILELEDDYEYAPLFD
jgi:Holliday junction resolvase RusA-like endonuclease